MFSLLKPFRFLAKALTAQASARELALGFAIGAVVGLVPKGNLLAIALMMVLGSLRVNLGAGMASAFLFSWVGMLLDPISHKIGQFVLTANVLEPMWTWMFNKPVIPWTAFNNTIVMGSFLSGLLLVYPLYKVSEPLFAKYAPPLAERLQKFKITKLLLGTEWAGRIGSA